jgi:type IV pilus assembly protein PilV
MPVPRTLAESRPARAGFSIIELLVSLTLLALGMLGLAGTAVSIARLQRQSASRALAATLAESRLELVRATQCIPSSGDSTVGMLIERWHVVPLGGNAHGLIDSITVPSAAHDAPRPEVFRSAVQC